jgi:hypothetical protein
MPHLRKSVLAITAIEKKIGVVKELRKNFQGRDDPDSTVYGRTVLSGSISRKLGRIASCNNYIISKSINLFQIPMCSRVTKT